MENICPNCGSPYVYDESLKRFKCRYCGYIKPREVLPEEEALLFSAAQRLRLADFDGAQEAYEDIAARFPECAEAHWGLALCEYGIKYEDDYDGKKIPTCYATRYESLLESPSFKKAVSLADDETKAYYRSQASLIERVREEWVEKAKKEPPYDIFLSFKDTDEGKRTEDSYDAYEIYNNLTRAGYRVFFSRVTLAGKSGENYEPYIFAALNSAPCMLLFASKPEYVTSTWVKNEWMRYLARIRQKKKSPDSLCVIFKDFNPSSLPAVLRGKQNLNYKELTFLKNLEAYVKKVIDESRAANSFSGFKRRAVTQEKRKEKKLLHAAAEKEVTSSLTKRVPSSLKEGSKRREVGASQEKKLTQTQEGLLNEADLYLGHADFSKAAAGYQAVLKENPTNGRALEGRLLCESKVKSKEEWVSSCVGSFSNFDLVNSLITYSDKKTATFYLSAYADFVLTAARAGRYAEAEKAYCNVAGFSAPCIDEIHIPLFEIVSKETRNREAISLAKKILPYLHATDTAYHQLALTCLWENVLSGGDFECAKDLEKQYQDSFDFDSGSYLLHLETELKARNLEDLLVKIERENRFELLQEDLPLTEDGINGLLREIGKAATSLIKANPRIANRFARLLVSLRYEAKAEFIKEGVAACCETTSMGDEEFFDTLMSALGDSDLSNYLKYQLDYASKKIESDAGPLHLENCERVAKRLASLTDYAPDSERLHHLRICALCGSPEKPHPDKMYMLKDFSDIEALISLRPRQKVDEVLSVYFASFFESIKKDGRSMTPYIDVFETLCSYLPKEEDRSLNARLLSAAEFAKENCSFEAASKLYAVLIGTYPEDPRFYWGLLQAKLNCKNDDDLIRQSHPISQMPEFANAKAAAGKNKELLARYIDVEMKQSAYLKAAHARKAKRRRKTILVSIGAAVTAFAIAFSVLIPKVIIPAHNVNSARSAIKQGDYDSALALLGDETFGEATNLRYMAQAGQSFDSENYEAAIDFVLSAGGEVKIYYDAEGKPLGKTSETIRPRGRFIDDCPASGYRMSGWEQDDFEITIGKADYGAVLWLKAKSYEAISYSITYELNGGINDPGNPLHYSVEDSVVLLAPTREGYSFLGWEDEVGNRFDSISQGTTGDLTLYAKWNDGDWFAANFDAAGGELSEESARFQFGRFYSLPIPEKTGYAFLGWYEGEARFESEGTWEWPTNKNLVAKWSPIVYDIVYDLSGGENNPSNPSTYTIEHEIKLASPSKTGYTFLGWYDTNGNRIESIAKGNVGKIRLIARWNGGDIYSITLNSLGGECEYDSIQVQFDHLYSLPHPTKTGYNFLGWYPPTGMAFPTEGVWNGTQDLSLTAKWEPVIYQITYQLFGGINDLGNPDEYTIEDEFNLRNPTRDGYSFAGWEDYAGCSVERIAKGTFGPLRFIAKWSSNTNNLSLSTNNEERGTVALLSGTGKSGETISVQATPKEGFLFEGWYASGSQVSADLVYSFEMPISDYSLEGRFWTIAEERSSLKTIEDGKTISYGLYPQTHVTDPATIASLEAFDEQFADSNGWYFLNNDYYACLDISGLEQKVFFEDGEQIKNGRHWFICEPIIWSVLSEKEGNCLLLASKILDVHELSKHQSEYDWPGSTARSWLNATFYSAAFGLGNEAIVTTSLDNSRDSAVLADGYYYSGNNRNTDDKVFLLSHADLINPDYGFEPSGNSDVKRKCAITDWAKVSGMKAKTDFEVTHYWTRSAFSEPRKVSGQYNYIFGVSHSSGEIVQDVTAYSYSSYTGIYYGGMRPAISLRKND